ncbi:caspase family protein [Mangrovitalea sediminis]|uniref:caspase family protein n=1 Tax=Mangrovitalea sediminis TaxID=1982043 RepID=UPI000BE4D3CA|nr:caspase family protein [Mangrovitalea sediminis]
MKGRDPWLIGRTWRRGAVILGVLVIAGCASQAQAPSVPNSAKADGLMIVDCLLPGQVRQLGTSAHFLTARRPIKTTADDCAIRGGEYTAYDRADYATALKVWLPQAKAGDPKAQVYVGEIYEKGMGLPPDYLAAAFWYRKAAAVGDTRAQIDLGNLYEKGLGVEKDPIEALNWYRKASGLAGDNLQYASTVVATQALQGEVSGLKKQVSQLTAAQRKAAQQLKVAQAAAHKVPEKSASAPPPKRSKTAPSIEILDPPIAVTRGGPVAVLRSGISERDVIGKVVAPEGLHRFTINGKPITVDQYHLFFAKVPVIGIRTPVQMQATDRQRQSSDFNFTLFINKEIDPNASKDIIVGSNQSEISAAGIHFGHYYALVIGNADYEYYPDLKTPVSDARAVAKVLTERYGFNTRLLLNATRYQMLSAINELRQKLAENDNLLIYYAGHGDLDSSNERGYWLPVNAAPGNTAHWLSNTAISDQLSTFRAKHILVIADSCYAGTLSSASVARQSFGEGRDYSKAWLKIMEQARARTVLTSGGIAPVLDKGQSDHSVFAQALLKALDDNHHLIDGNRLYLMVLRQVRADSTKLGLTQTPDYGAIKYAGHEAGEFFLVPKA